MKTDNPQRIQKQAVFRFALIIISVMLVFSLNVVYAATPTPTGGGTPTGDIVTFTVKTQVNFDVTLSAINLSPASLEGISSISANGMHPATVTVSYPANTQITLTGVGSYNTEFYGWSGSSIPLSGNPVSFIPQGGELIVGNFFGHPPYTPTPTKRPTPTPTPSATPTPTIPVNAIKITVGLLCDGEVSSSTAIINMSPASLEGINRVSGGYNGSYSIQSWTLSYLPNTNVTFTATSIDRTQFSGWYAGSTPPLSGNPVAVTVQGGEKIIGEFWAPFPTRRITPTFQQTPTPTLRTVTPTPSGRSYLVSYVIQSDWGNGATVNVTIKNNSASAVNGWTLLWTFPGNQTIINLWSGTYTQSGQAVSVKNAGYNANIPAGGGTVNFGFNLNYSGTNAKPVSFTLNGTACQIQ